MTKRPRTIISKERHSLDKPIKLPPMKANKLLMSMAFLLENMYKYNIYIYIFFIDTFYLERALKYSVCFQTI